MGANGNICASRRKITLIWKGDMLNKTIPRLLLIAGTGRNSGKTTFACKTISKHCITHPIVAIKIASHFHENVASGRIILNRENLYVAEETNSTANKDSSLMLAAGARKSYFVMANDAQLKEAFDIILNLISEKDYLVCESGGLRNYIKPGVFLVFHNSENKRPKSSTAKLKDLCNCFITLDGNAINFDNNNLLIANNSWKIKE